MFCDAGLYPLAQELRSQWRLIRQEYLELNAPVLDLHRSGDAELYAETLLNQNGRTSLLAGRRDRAATSRLLARLQGFHVAALSVMQAGSFIAPHDHPELKDRLLTLHLGLDVVPQRSFLCVDRDVREQRAGHVLIFDGSRQHFAINMSKADRAVLYIEFYPGMAAFAAA